MELSPQSNAEIAYEKLSHEFNDLSRKYAALAESLKNNEKQGSTGVFELASATLYNIFDTNVIGIIFSDSRKIIKDVNDQAVKICGLNSKAALIGSNIMEFNLFGISVEQLSVYIDMIAETGNNIEFDSRIRGIDDKSAWMHVIGQKTWAISPDGSYAYGVLWTLLNIDRRKNTEEKLRLAKNELERYFNNDIAGIFICRKHRIVKCNTCFARMFRFDSVAEVTDLPLSIFYPDIESYDSINMRIKETLQVQDNIKFEHQFIRRDGSLIWCQCNGHALDNNNIRNGFFWIIEDITARKEAEEKLRIANNELEGYFNNDIAGIFVAKRGRVVRSNKRFARMFKYDSVEDILGLNIRDIHLTPQRYIDFTDNMFKILQEKNNILIEYKFKCRDGAIIWCQCHGKALDTGDLQKGFFWIVEDITARKEAEQKLITMATVDELSQTYNRRHFMELARRVLIRHEKNKQPISILMLDIDNFKQINDSYGHTTGDQSISYFAAVCKELLREHDIIGRLGGDEFCIVLPESSGEYAQVVANKIISRFNSSLGNDYEILPALTTSIGIRAISDINSADMDHYIAQADNALYHAKANGRNCYEIFIGN